MEIWKDIPGFEGLYKASNLWNVKSLERLSRGRYNNLQKFKSRVLKPQKRWAWFYYAVDLSKNWKIKSFRISRLIWAAFLGLNLFDKEIFVCHKDDNPYNNKLDNLFLWTAKDNSQDMVEKWRQGWYKNKWQNNWMAKFTNKEIEEIKEFIKKWFKPKFIKNIFNISDSYLSNLKKRIWSL